MNDERDMHPQSASGKPSSVQDELRYEPIGAVGGDPSQWAFPVRFETPHEVIRASAGSGKTYQLSNRYLGLLRNEVAAEQILATTFTRKAAGEILERILTRLASAATSDKAAQELAEGLLDDTLDTVAAKQMLVRLCATLHRVSVSTIDSFFNRVAQMFRHELRLPPDPTIAGDDDPMVIQLRARAIEAMLSDDDTQTLVSLLRRLHHDDARRSVTEAIDEIVKRLYETYRMTEAQAWDTLEVGDTLDDAAIASCIAELEPLVEQVTNKSVAKAIAKSVRQAVHGDWQGFISQGPAAAVVANPKAPKYGRSELPADVVAAYRPLVAHARSATLASIRDRTLAMHELMQRFDAHFTHLREAHHVLLYADLPHRLIQYMQQVQAEQGDSDDWNADLHYRMDARVLHLLLDEFQDTSFEQWAVLKPFADEITSTANQSRSFFCVGDVKQAIYGWRGGRAEIFDRLRDDLQLDESAIRQLNDNYRSSQVVLDVVNNVFSGLGANRVLQVDKVHRAEAADWQGMFDTHTAKRDMHGFVELRTTPAPSADSDDATHSAGDSDHDDENNTGVSTCHLDAVAAQVQQLWQQAKGFSIGVLAWRNKTVEELLYRLGRRGVPASGEGGVAIVGDPAINLIMAAMQLADHPGDRVAAYALYNSPMRDALPLPSTSRRDRDDCAWRIRSAVQTRGLTATLERWAASLVPACDADSARRLTQLIELADQFTPTGSPRLRDFCAYIEGATVEQPSSASVRVMTVHKSKGLEFDIVVLPELGKKPGQIAGKDVLIDQDDASDAISAVYAHAKKAVRALSPQLTEAYRQEQARRIREGFCVLYVAMTRARHALHLMVEPLARNKDGKLAKRGHKDQSFAAILRAALCADEVEEATQGDQQLFAHGESDWYGKQEAGESQTAIAARLPRFKVDRASMGLLPRNRPSRSPSSLHAGRDQTVSDWLDVSSSFAQLRGSVIHAWFEQIEWLDEDGALPTIDWLSIARAAVPTPLADDWLAEQFVQFEAMLQHDVVRQVLTPPAGEARESLEVWRERPFVVAANDHLVQGVFDRVVIHREREQCTSVDLIDFKTDTVADGAACDALCARYRPQVEAYRDALCRLFDVDDSRLTASLLFVGAGMHRTMG